LQTSTSASCTVTSSGASAILTTAFRGAAVQYLFFLWRSEHSIADAIAVTDLLVSHIGVLWASIVFPKRRRLLTHLTGLMILLLAEVSDQGTEQQVLAATKKALSASAPQTRLFYVCADPGVEQPSLGAT
jgi:hypothetical protein